MGQRGPIPKRSDERTRRNKEGKDGLEVKKGVAHPWQWEEPDPEWHPEIIKYYNAFRHTGMSAYYQQTDVAQLRLACYLLSEEMNKSRVSAVQFANALGLLEGLGATEGERRRMKIELEEAHDEDLEQAAKDAVEAKVTDIRDRLNKAAESS